MRKTFYLALIIISLVLFTSCTTENNIIDNPVIENSAGNLNDENESDSLNNNEISTQIGELLIITLKGQEPIQNDDGTITLPGGGTYIDSNDEKVIISGRTIIRSDGSFSKDIGNGLNIDTAATIENIDGSLFVINKDGGTYSVPAEHDSDENRQFEGDYTFKLEDGTKVTVPFADVMEIINHTDNKYTLILNSPGMIEFTNGVKVNVPVNTEVVIWNNVFTATIDPLNNGEATIIQPNGTTSTVPAGTILDSEGNIKN